MSRQNFREELRPFLDVTDADVRAAMAAVPEDVRARLAAGPHPRRWTCGVCEAFGHAWYKNVGAWERSNPLHVVFCFHEVPKIEMRDGNDQWYGTLANDVYRRCIATYQAAGWTGEPQEPNA